MFLQRHFWGTWCAFDSLRGPFSDEASLAGLTNMPCASGRINLLIWNKDQKKLHWVSFPVVCVSRVLVNFEGVSHRIKNVLLLEQKIWPYPLKSLQEFYIIRKVIIRTLLSWNFKLIGQFCQERRAVMYHNPQNDSPQISSLLPIIIGECAPNAYCILLTWIFLTKWIHWILCRSKEMVSWITHTRMFLVRVMLTAI